MFTLSGALVACKQRWSGSMRNHTIPHLGNQFLVRIATLRSTKHTRGIVWSRSRVCRRRIIQSVWYTLLYEALTHVTVLTLSKFENRIIY